MHATGSKFPKLKFLLCIIKNIKIEDIKMLIIKSLMWTWDRFENAIINNI